MNDHVAPEPGDNEEPGQETGSLARISMSLPAELLLEADKLVARRQLPSRSQLIAELIRHELANLDGARDDDVQAGAITLIYSAESSRTRNALARVQREFLKEIISSQHVFLEDGRSLEVLLIQGAAIRLNGLCNRLRSVRAVQQLKLVTTTFLLPPLQFHD
jgi:CopG family nickel-responsive transcriptional regulator